MSTTTAKAQQIARALDDKAYSEAFVEAEISTTVPFQIRAMRKQRKWTQAQLAEKTEQNQKTISDFENPDIGPHTLTSLRKVAAAFDVGLIVRFAPFSEIVDWTSNLSKQNHSVPERTKDVRLKQQRVARGRDDSTFSDQIDTAATGKVRGKHVLVFPQKKAKDDTASAAVGHLDTIEASVGRIEASVG